LAAPFNLNPPQHPMVKWVRKHKRCALWAGMGIGKTTGVMFALTLMRLCDELKPGPILVVAPARVAKDTWPEEGQRWQQFQGIRITSLSGSPANRRRLLQGRLSGIYTISYELLPWLVEHFLEKWPFRTVIADESDRLKGFREKSPRKSQNAIGNSKAGKSGKRAHAISRVAHNLTDRWINLTGTPSPNGLKDLWGQTWFLDRGARLGRTYTAFKQRWFMPKWNGKGIQPQTYAEQQIHAALADICLTVDPKDYFPLKDPIEKPVYVKLPPRARALYDKMERDMFIELKSKPINALTAAGVVNKCLQLASGAIYTDYPEWEEVHDEKIQALQSIKAESGGTPLLVAYQFKSDKARILRAFPGAVDIANATGLERFKKGEADIGIAHPKSMGHGIDGLQRVTNILVRFGRDWDLGASMQMLERIGPMRQLQAKLDRNVFVYNIIARATLDVDVVRAHASKRSVQDALLLATKERG
jgi:SNF2 family DNA or RNA helicase